MSGVLTYLAIGVIWVLMEFRTFSTVEFETSRAAFYGSIQLGLHLFRVWLTWPLYLVEDFFLWLENRGYDE